MKTIILVQSRIDPHTLERERRAYGRSLSSCTLRSISTLDHAQPWDEPERFLSGVHGVIIGGSSDFDLHGGRTHDDPARVGAREILERIRPLIVHALEHHFPMLGVCFGHQLIAEVQGGNVVSDPEQRKFGSYDVAKLEEAIEDPLFSDLPDAFVAQYGHKDAVSALPHGAVLLARGDACHFSALRYGTRVYTTQFHPELTGDDMRTRIEAQSQYLPEGMTAAQAVRSSPEAEMLLTRFVERIVSA